MRESGPIVIRPEAIGGTLGRALAAETEQRMDVPATAGHELRVQLDAPLPAELAVGAGSALFVCGTCFSARARVTELAIVVDGDEQPVIAHGMPRLDTMRAFHPGLDPYETAGMAADPASREDPLFTSYRSGFWGLARIGPRPAGASCRLELRARLDDGRSVSAPLAELALRSLDRPLDLPRRAPEVAICMATFQPPIDLFERQVASIRAQTHRDWVCVISDDGSDPRRFAELEAVVAGDDRFRVSRSDRRLGFYRNFERALALAPAGARYVALADQDDVWFPEKLATLVHALGDARLVYSDARVIGREGDVRSDTYWSRRRNNHEDLLSLLVANAVTGAAALFPRDLLDDALPFPPAQFAHYHDHWLGLVALATGEIRFVDRPLYDYVQHGSAALGHAQATRMPALRDRLGALRRDPRERVRMWRMHYFVDACRLLQFAAVLRVRCGDRMDRRKRRALDRFERADGSLVPLAALAVRGARELVGRPETLGAEWMLAHAFAWRRMLAATVRDRPARGLRLDAVPPAALDPQPGERSAAVPALQVLADKVSPLRLTIASDAPQRINLLVPTIDLQHFFGGYIAKLNLARRLARHGHRVRLVTVDPVGPLPWSWRRELEAYAGLDRAFDELEVAFGRESGLEVSGTDVFVATTWWTAHIAHDAVRALGGDRFLYLIQEYEPFTFPMGSYAALAAESYRLPHTALFSTELLRGYFRRHALGVYASGADAGDRASAAFENAITPIDAPAAAELAARRTRRLLFYARPEPHAARNMFELGVLALRRALEDGAFDAGWSLHGIGTVEAGRRVDLGDASLELLPRAAQRDYGALLRDHDVGLSLMYTPHPSLVPIEMASAGMLTVTNTFENKTPEALREISPNLIAAEPTVAGVAAALRDAAAAAGDADARVRGSRVRWSRDWDRSFDAALLARISDLLGT